MIVAILLLEVCRYALTLHHATPTKRQFGALWDMWYTCTLSVNEKWRKHKRGERIMPQVAIAGTDTRINGQHSRVTYYQELDAPAYHVTDTEIDNLCCQSRYRTINLANEDMLDLIDSMGENGRVFM